MPWTAKDAKSHCKDCNPSKWASIANAALKWCQNNKGSGCEGRAIRIANSKSKLDEPVEDLIQAALEELEEELSDEYQNGRRKKKKGKTKGGDPDLLEIAEELKEKVENDELLDSDVKQAALEFLENDPEEDELDEFEAYYSLMALETWKAPTKRKEVPRSHFFWPEKKKYPYKNPDGSVNCAGVMAAWKMAHGARSGKRGPSWLIKKIQPWVNRCKKGNGKKKSADPTTIQKDAMVFHVMNEQEITLESTAEGRPRSSIQMLREGRYEHPWWGTLLFDNKLFNTMIRNFKDGIPYGEIALDFKHMPELGAAAWVKGVKKKFVDNKQGLFFDVEWTLEGEKSIKEGRFKFSSIEFNDNYKDVETGKMYGPTILGGALTNRPFIKKMKPLALSDDGEFELEFEESEKEVDEDMNLEEIQAQIDEIRNQIAQLSEQIKDDPKPELSEKLEELGTQLSEAMEELKKALEAKNGDDEKLQASEKRVKELEDKVSNLSDTCKSLLDERVRNEDKAYKASIKAKMAEFKSMGVTPALCQVAEKVLLADGAHTVELTVKSLDDKGEEQEEKVNLLQAVTEIFETLPEEALVETDERTVKIRESSAATRLDVAAVEKYAKEKEITFDEALIELDKQGKLVDD